MNLVMCFDKDAEAVRRSQPELLGDVPDQIPDPGVGGNLKYLERDDSSPDVRDDRSPDVTDGIFDQDVSL